MIVPALDPAILAADIEAEARAGNWELSYLSPTSSGVRPWLHRAGARVGAPRVYLSAGIHGDEIAGPLAVLEMLRRPGFFQNFEMWIFPLLNPDGLARGSRGNADGIDLNRDFKNTKSVEIRSLCAIIDTLPTVAAAIFLHEDFEATGAYLYELNDSTLPITIGLDIIAAMGRHVPIDLRPEIEEVAASGGVLSRRDLILKFGPIEEREEWPEAIYLNRKHTQASYTTETPMLQPLADRVAAQIAAVSTLLAAVQADA